MSRARVRTLRAAAALLAACTLAACTGSGDELDVEGFAEGTCSDLKEPLQDVDEALRQVADEDLAPKDAAARFAELQKTLKAQAEQAEGEVGPAVTELVTSLGFFRISVDTNGYDGSQDEAVRTELEAVAETCRAS